MCQLAAAECRTWGQLERSQAPLPSRPSSLHVPYPGNKRGEKTNCTVPISSGHTLTLEHRWKFSAE